MDGRERESTGVLAPSLVQVPTTQLTSAAEDHSAGAVAQAQAGRINWKIKPTRTMTQHSEEPTNPTSPPQSIYQFNVGKLEKYAMDFFCKLKLLISDFAS